jgi:hypothetical protein
MPYAECILAVISVNDQQPIDPTQGSNGEPDSPASVSDAPSAAVLDGLQESMEEIALGQSPNHGRFCGNCYGRLSEPSRRRPSRLPASICKHCGARTDATPQVHAVPAEVLELYMAKRKREGLIVNLFAFLGIFLALVLSAVVWLITPDNLWKIAPFLVLILGAYYLARVIGYNVGVPVGSRAGRNIRDARWAAYLQRRQTQGEIVAENGNSN